MTKDKNIKSTCNKKSVPLVLPKPTAKVLAQIVGVSESLVKKVRTGDREDNTENAQLVKYCDELIVGGQDVLIKEVKRAIDNIKNPQ